jgi:hypothetical protein
MMKAKDEVQNLPKRAINALHLNHVKQFILRRKNRTTVKGVKLATANFLSEQEYYLFHMDTFGLQPSPMQATYKRHYKQCESTNSFPEIERKRHIRHNTNDTDLTPVINNLTGRSNPVKKTALVSSLDPMASPVMTKGQNERHLGHIDVDVLSDEVRYHSSKGGSVRKSPNVAYHNHNSNRDAKGKRQQNKKNWAPKESVITADAIRSQGTVKISAIPKNLPKHKGCVRSDPPRNSSVMAEKHVLSERRQQQNLFKEGRQLQPHKSNEHRQVKLSKTYQYDPWPDRDKYKVATTSIAYCF